MVTPRILIFLKKNPSSLPFIGLFLLMWMCVYKMHMWSYNPMLVISFPA